MLSELNGCVVETTLEKAYHHHHLRTRAGVYQQEDVDPTRVRIPTNRLTSDSVTGDVTYSIPFENLVGIEVALASIGASRGIKDWPDLQTVATVATRISDSLELELGIPQDWLTLRGAVLRRYADQLT